MKKLLTLTLLVLFASASSLFAQHQHIGNGGSPHDTVTGKNITVAYGRPLQKGRVLFGTQADHDNKKALEVYGLVWRTGADEATEITFKKDCTFGDKQVKAGTYTLFTIPGTEEWTIILNSQLGQWGAYSYEKNKSKDVLKTTVKANHSNKPVEQLTISLPDNGMKIEWGNVVVFVPVK